MGKNNRQMTEIGEIYARHNSKSPGSYTLYVAEDPAPNSKVTAALAAQLEPSMQTHKRPESDSDYRLFVLLEIRISSAVDSSVPTGSRSAQDSWQ